MWPKLRSPHVLAEADASGSSVKYSTAKTPAAMQAAAATAEVTTRASFTAHRDDTASRTSHRSRRMERLDMNWKLELVAIPVSDVDRAKSFYVEKVGFNADHDHTVSDEIRFVQLTPPGSRCSIALGRGVTDAPPG